MGPATGGRVAPGRCFARAGDNMRRYTRRKLLPITLVSAAANGIGFKTSIEPVTSPTPDASTDTGVVDAGTIDTAVGGNGIDAGTVVCW